MDLGLTGFDSGFQSWCNFKAAEAHLSQTALQRFQRFADQRLLEHGVSEGVLWLGYAQEWSGGGLVGWVVI